MDGQDNKDIKNLEVLIDGRVYTLAGSCSEEHLQRIGRHIDKKITEARRVKPITAYNFDLSTLYIMINLTDDLIYKTDRASTAESECARLTGELKKQKAELDDLRAKFAELSKQLEAEKRENAAYKSAVSKNESAKAETVKKTV